jgi:hypothetical protein
VRHDVQCLSDARGWNCNLQQRVLRDSVRRIDAQSLHRSLRHGVLHRQRLRGQRALQQRHLRVRAELRGQGVRRQRLPRGFMRNVSEHGRELFVYVRGSVRLQGAV